MTSAPNIVHLAKTPLVGAPGKLAAALERYTRFRAFSIIGNDYPNPLKGLFIGDSILVGGAVRAPEICAEVIRRADVIHVHNDLTPALLDLVRREAPGSCRYVYQVHSPLREGPLYFDRADTLGLEWSAKLSIPHYPQRFFQDYRLVPNVILPTSSVHPLGERDRVRILFSPAHRRSGLRWGDKVSDALVRALTVVRSLTDVEILEIEGVAPSALLALRRTTHVTIDEIVTGAFHQISLEGLCAGNVVVNAADSFALASLRMAIRASVDPPFVRMEQTQVCEALLELVRDRNRIRALQSASHEYYEAFLRPERLIGFFAEIYDEVLSGPRS